MSIYLIAKEKKPCLERILCLYLVIILQEGLSQGSWHFFGYIAISHFLSKSPRISLVEYLIPMDDTKFLQLEPHIFSLLSENPKPKV